MKIFFTFFLLIASLISPAQWSNTANQFYDSLHMPVCTAADDQIHSMSITSYPDSGTIVFWEDGRNGLYAKGQIYAQKYDKNGNQLWAANGIVISSGANNQHFYSPTNTDYRNYSYAATDSAGGFYICYADDSISSYVWERLVVQHIQSDGTTVFPGPGFILDISDVANHHLVSQLIADGNGGFFISYLKGGAFGTKDLYVYCYKDNNGTLKHYGGGLVNRNGFEISHTGHCGNYVTVVEYIQTYTIDYKIYPDLQKGCNVVMTYSQNGGEPDINLRLKTAFNWLWRVKKDATTDTAFFPKDSVVLFYNLNIHNDNLTCVDEETNIVYNYPTSNLISNGFIPVTNWVYDAQHTKGAIVPTDGNINANIIAVNNRNLNGSGPTNWFTRVLYRPQQKFDSIPYEYTVDPYLPSSIFGKTAPGQNKLGSSVSDTLMYDPVSSYFYDFSLASGGNKIFATCILNNGARNNVLLQQLQVQKITTDSFSLELNTSSKYGVVIGKEVSTGFSGTSIDYDLPIVTVDKNGNALFYIREFGRSVRVSPIQNGTELAWGAMGKPVGSGYYNGNHYPSDNPFVSIDPLDGTGVICWQDSKNIPLNSGTNISMRHIDSVSPGEYMPLVNKVKLIPTPYGAQLVNPYVLLGSSKQFTVLEFSNANISLTPVIAILDNYNLGIVTAKVYENTGAIRVYNGSPYLNRNYLIKPENDPSGTPIHVRLYFANEEFDALKTADPTILDPGMLTVVKQPNAGTITPDTYVPAGGEEVITPIAWKAVPGGYYVEIIVSSFSNFFIQGANGALPLIWLNIHAQWVGNNHAKISWQVAHQINVKKYNLQHSYDGAQFANVCEIAATNAEYYNCTVPAEKGRMHYYRVLQTDVDGRSSLSKIVALASSVALPTAIYPNPVINEMHVTELGNYREFIIVNVEGKVIKWGKLTAATKSISVKHLQDGAYILKLIGNTEVRSLKFIKK